MGVRLAFRTLLRSRWYAITAIGTIALTIALGSTVFAVVDGVLFKPLPYPGADRLFTLLGSANPEGLRNASASLAPADVRYLAEADPRISITAVGSVAALSHPDQPGVTIGSARVDRYFFDVLGQRPLVGGFRPDDFTGTSADDAPAPAVVSHAFWREWLGADPAAVGRTVRLAPTTIVIVGVLPQDFLFPLSSFSSSGAETAILLPLIPPPATANDRWARGLDALARLREDISEPHAREALNRALASRAREYPPRAAMPGPYVAVNMAPLANALGQRERPLFSVALSAVALLIVLGAINVTGLFAARARDRGIELSIRSALGARRRQLVSVLLGEAFVIALLGGALGVILARPLLDAALAVLPDTLRLLKPPGVDWRVAAFALLASSVPVLVFAFAPALGAMRRALAPRLAGTATSTPRAHALGRRMLLAGESAIGITLVVTGSLLLTSFVVLRAEDPGFDVESLAIVEVQPSGPASPQARAAFAERVLDGLRRVPGVRDAASVGAPILKGGFAGSQFKSPPGAERIMASDTPVSAAFFDIAGLRLLQGRVPTHEEIEAGRPLAVVSEGTARAYWRAATAIGQILQSDAIGTVTVVGVVEDARTSSQADEARFGEIYLPARTSRQPPTTFFVKTASDPDLAVLDIALALRGVVPGAIVRRAESFDTALAQSVRLQRFRTILFGLSAGASLLLLAVGVGGLVATGVAQRVREIGVRAALGARQPQLVRMIVVEHLRPAVIGVALGLLASWWTSRLLRSFLYEIDPHEPAVWVAATGTLMLVVAFAAWLPARRASAVDPVVVLRTE